MKDYRIIQEYKWLKLQAPSGKTTEGGQTERQNKTQLDRANRRREREGERERGVKA
jgi:hypothetical protein